MKKAELSLVSIMAMFGAIQADASIAVVTDPKTGKKYSVKTVTEYVAGFLTQLENGEMLIQANQPQVGIRSIRGNKIAEGKLQIVTETRFLFDTTQAVETAAVLATLPFASVAPPAFKHGEFRLAQTGELLRTSGSDVTNFKASTGNDADFRDIVPVLLRGGIETSANIKLAAAATAGHAFKWEYRAIELTPIGAQ